MFTLGAFAIVCSILGYFVLFAVSIVILTFLGSFFARVENYGFYYRYDDPKLDELKHRISTVIPEINNIDIYGSNQSFTIDKKTTYICSKDKREEYYPDNMLIYVILHELAHALSSEVGHTKVWENIYQNLLERAEKGGIYDSKIPVISDYCGY